MSTKIAIDLTSVKTLAECQTAAKAAFEGKPENADAKARSNGAKDFLRSLLAQLEDGDLKQAIGIVAGAMSEAGITLTRNRSSLKTNILAYLQDEKNGGKISKLNAFTMFDAGPTEMREVIKGLVNLAPEKRVWVMFDGTDYAIVGTGPEAPANFVGPKPSAEKPVKAEPEATDL